MKWFKKEFYNLQEFSISFRYSSWKKLKGIFTKGIFTADAYKLQSYNSKQFWDLLVGKGGKSLPNTFFFTYK